MTTLKGFAAGAFTTAAAVFAVTPQSVYMDTNTLETNPNVIAATMDASSLTTPIECIDEARNTVEDYRNFVTMSERVASMDPNNRKEVTDIANTFIDLGIITAVDVEKLEYTPFSLNNRKPSMSRYKYRISTIERDEHSTYTDRDNKPEELFEYNPGNIHRHFKERLDLMGTQFDNTITNETLVTQAAITNCTIEKTAEEIAKDNRDANRRAGKSPAARLLGL